MLGASIKILRHSRRQAPISLSSVIKCSGNVQYVKIDFSSDVAVQSVANFRLAIVYILNKSNLFLEHLSLSRRSHIFSLFRLNIPIICIGFNIAFLAMPLRVKRKDSNISHTSYLT